jgi:hypothetical protein
MTVDHSTLQALQKRVDQIAATGDADLAGRAWHALSRVLLDYARKQDGRQDMDMFEVRMVLARKALNA